MKVKGISFILLCCICLTSCKMSITDIANIKAAIQDEKTYENVEAHSKEEMQEYALERLQNKYDMEFVIEEEGLKYGYWDKERKDFLYMTGWAHVLGDEEKKFAFKVKEPNDFSDNYEINYYKDEIDSYIRNEWSDLDSDYDIEIDHGLSKKKFNPKMDYKDYLYSGQTTIFFYAYVEDVEDHSEYVSLIKAWLEKLYNADFKWYFELREKGNDELQYFTLNPGDNGFTSADDWSDELIAKYIEDNIKSYHWRESKRRGQR